MQIFTLQTEKQRAIPELQFGYGEISATGECLPGLVQQKEQPGCAFRVLKRTQLLLKLCSDIDNSLLRWKLLTKVLPIGLLVRC